MIISYDRLWHMLIDRHMSKTDLIKKSNITTNAMARLGKNQDVRVEVLAKQCSFDDIMEIIPSNNGKEQ